MKLEDQDLIELAKSNNYNFIFEEERFGIQPNRPAIFFPNSISHFLNENSDEEGIYWINKKGHERILVEVMRIMFTEEPYRSEKRMILKTIPQEKTVIQRNKEKTI